MIDLHVMKCEWGLDTFVSVAPLNLTLISPSDLNFFKIACKVILV